MKSMFVKIVSLDTFVLIAGLMSKKNLLNRRNVIMILILLVGMIVMQGCGSKASSRENQHMSGRSNEAGESAGQVKCDNNIDLLEALPDFETYLSLQSCLNQQESTCFQDRRNCLQLVGSIAAIVGEHEYADIYYVDKYREEFGVDDFFYEETDSFLFQKFQQSYSPITLSDYVKSMPDSVRLFLVNESHQSSRARKNLSRILNDLYSKGFRYLALEALNNDGKTEEFINQNGYPLTNSGFYINDPQFSRMVRHAVNIGFSVVSYELSIGQKNGQFQKNKPMRLYYRDSIQADNIYRKTKKDDPDAKVVVLAGFDHIIEASMGERSQVGYYLRDLFSSDPVTLDQTEMTAANSKDDATHIFRRVINADNSLSGETIVFTNKLGELYVGKKDGFIDGYIWSFPTQKIDGRAGWIFSGTNKVHLSLPEFIDTYNGEVLIRALRDTDKEGAVPVDQFIYKKGKSLALDSGAYKIQWVGREGKILMEQTIKVPN